MAIPGKEIKQKLILQIIQKHFWVCKSSANEHFGHFQTACFVTISLPGIGHSGVSKVQSIELSKRIKDGSFKVY